ncbi:hypothetical protein Tco_0168667 [Tanacetum coccineum]
MDIFGHRIQITKRKTTKYESRKPSKGSKSEDTSKKALCTVGNIAPRVEFERAIDDGYSTCMVEEAYGEDSRKGTLKLTNLKLEDGNTFVKDCKFNLSWLTKCEQKELMFLFTDSECLVRLPILKFPVDSQSLKIPRQNTLHF